MILYVFVLALFTACQDDAFDFSEKSREIKFSLTTQGEVMTKATRTNFDVGDKIGIYVVRHLPYNSPVLLASGNFANNKCFKVVNGNILQPASEADKIFVESDGYAYSIYAYYPYDETITDPTNIDFEINSYQVEMQGVKKGDFMLCQVLNSDIINPISLNFKRKLSLINVIYNKEPDGIKPVIAIYGFYSNCKINLQTGILTEGYNEYSSIAPMLRYYEDINQCHYCAIVAPYNFKNGVTFQVNKNGNISHYSIPNHFPLQEGTENIFYLSESPKNVSCSVVSDVGIGGTVSGNGTYTKGQLCTVTATVNDEYIFDGWYIGNELVSKNLSYSFSVSSDVHLEAHFHVLWKLTYTSNIDTNLLKPYLESISGSGEYRNGEYAKGYINLKPGSPYVFYCWTENGKVVTYDWRVCTEMRSNKCLKAIFAKVIYDYEYITPEISFNSNSIFEYIVNAPTLKVSFPADKWFMCRMFAYFDGEELNPAMYSTFPINRVSLCNDEGIAIHGGSIDGGYVGTKISKAKAYNVKYELKYKHLKHGNTQFRGRIRYRIYGFYYEDSFNDF